MTEAGEQTTPQYDVCLSFAGEQREYVEQVAKLLRKKDVRVYYDRFETETMWGLNLYSHFDEVYNRASRFCVLFCSADYARKAWTMLEWRSAQDRVMTSDSVYLLPVRFDDTRIPGIGDAIGYIDARLNTPAELVDVLLRRLGKLGRLSGQTGTTTGKTGPAAVLVLATEDDASRPWDVLAVALDNSRIALPATLLHRTPNRVIAVVPFDIAGPVDVLTSLLPSVERAAADQPGRLRLGVHVGGLSDTPDWSGEPVTHAVTMTDDSVIGGILGAATQADIVVVLSARYYEQAVQAGSAGSSPGAYRRVRLSDAVDAWVRVPGYPKPPLPPKDAQPVPSATKVNQFYGPVRARQIGDNYYPGGGDGG